MITKELSQKLSRAEKKREGFDYNNYKLQIFNSNCSLHFEYKYFLFGALNIKYLY